MTPAQYRKNAEDCRQQAEMSKSLTDKAAWLKLAEQWLKLAEQAEPRKNGATNPARTGKP